jgi:hypothetical protein
MTDLPAAVLCPIDVPRQRNKSGDPRYGRYVLAMTAEVDELLIILDAFRTVTA